MSIDPNELAARVTDEASFLRFLKALRDDWRESASQEEHTPSSPYGASANGWENPQLGPFLEAAIAWAEATAKSGARSANAWRRCAEILLAAKMYE